MHEVVERLSAAPLQVIWTLKMVTSKVRVLHDGADPQYLEPSGFVFVFVFVFVLVLAFVFVIWKEYY